MRGVDGGLTQGHWGNGWDWGTHSNLSPIASVDHIICQCFLSTIVELSLLVGLKSNFVLVCFKKRESCVILWWGSTLEYRALGRGSAAVTVYGYPQPHGWSGMGQMSCHPDKRLHIPHKAEWVRTGYGKQ